MAGTPPSPVTRGRCSSSTISRSLYFANYAPGTPGFKHLQDETAFDAAVANGTLPAVSFVKPYGADNEHPGYTDLYDGDAQAAALVEKIMHSSDWKSTAVIVTYDENGGFWDHVPRPNWTVSGTAPGCPPS